MSAPDMSHAQEALDRKIAAHEEEEARCRQEFFDDLEDVVDTFAEWTRGELDNGKYECRRIIATVRQDRARQFDEIWNVLESFRRNGYHTELDSSIVCTYPERVIEWDLCIKLGSN